MQTNAIYRFAIFPSSFARIEGTLIAGFYDIKLMVHSAATAVLKASLNDLRGTGFGPEIVNLLLQTPRSDREKYRVAINAEIVDDVIEFNLRSRPLRIDKRTSRLLTQLYLEDRLENDLVAEIQKILSKP